ncbi:hypothetical protein E4U42_003947 [Claviceps africana]|uniref:AB hydrolase-1 domain-containing protein n=1 Tax=Claviceps africana TaxID=83212 RepID=A0A8K0NL56_9HYPO|nr:hypothetical protein E4U42_003947 [Claviceps africana]
MPVMLVRRADASYKGPPARLIQSGRPMLRPQAIPAVLQLQLQRSRIVLSALAASVPTLSTSTSSSSSSSTSTSSTSSTSSASPQSGLDMSSNADAPTQPKTQPKPARQGPLAYFPLGYKDAAYQWWNSVTPQMAERAVLSMVPYLKETVHGLAAPSAARTTTPATLPQGTNQSEPDPFGTRTWRQSLVQLSGKDRALNEVCIERQGEEVEETLVMVHGYGAGLGFFFKNFEPITRIPGLRLYALDMLGMGNSSRPAFRIHARGRDEKVDEAESWFIDALEEWRKARRIERFTLLGHSLGGYLAVSYAIKYPGHLKKLILASPVGIPEDPYAVNSSLPEPGESTVQNEFTQDQQTATTTGLKHPVPVPVKNGPQHATGADGQEKQQQPSPAQTPPSAPKRPLPGWLVWLWDANVSPFSIVRYAGPLGPRFVSGWSSRRFNHLPADEAEALHEYSFSIFKQKGSGEYALSYILAPGAYARRPVINRIHLVGRQPLPQPSPSTAIATTTAAPRKETGIPIVFMYGENDWMDVAGGLAAEQKLQEARTQALLHASDEESRNENGAVRVIIVPKAGHHLYLDNADYFNEVLRKEMEETKAEGKRHDKNP